MTNERRQLVRKVALVVAAIVAVLLFLAVTDDAGEVFKQPFFGLL